MFDRSDDLNTLPGRGLSGLVLPALAIIGAFVIIVSSPWASREREGRGTIYGLR